MVVVDSVVKACIDLYNTLPKSGKPSAEEWTVISAIVGDFGDGHPKVLSMGTGSKCLGRSSMSPKGDVLNDSHAEVIARRSFLKYLYLEILKLNQTKVSEVLIRDGDGFNVRVNEKVKFYFVTSMTPCGDASIMPKDEERNTDSDCGSCLETSFTNQCESSNKRSYSFEEFNSKKMKIDLECQSSLETENTNKDIYRTGAKCLPASFIQDPHLPGIFYHSIGAVRTKPGRGDPTCSLSCSDKMARWNSVGWQGALLSIFIKEPIFMSAIICGGGVPFSIDSFNRAINERIKRTEFIPIHQSNLHFPSIKTEGKRPNSSSIIWCRGCNKDVEVSINGRRQGVTKKNLNKKSARVSICKKELFILFKTVVNSFPNSSEDFLSEKSLMDMTYGGLKSKATEYQRRWKDVKEDCFGLWADKPKNMLDFQLGDDD